MNNKYIYFDDRKRFSKYYIHRKINGKFIYFGSYATLNEAILMREFLEFINWNKELFDKIYAKMKGIIEENKYIKYHKPTKKYVVHKRIGNEMVHFATCETLEEARAERDYLMMNNWDWDLIVEESIELTEQELKYGANFKRAKNSMYKK